MVVRFQCAWPSLRTIAISHARFQHSISAPVAADSAAGREGWRSQTEGEKRRDDWAELAPDQAAQGFPCHGAQNGSAAFQSYQLDFHVTTQPSLILSWAPRKNRSPVPLVPSSFPRRS